MPNYTIQFRAMGCQIQAWLSVKSIGEAAVLRDVPGWFERWEAVLSRFRPESELSRLNARTGTWVEVSPLLIKVIQAARRASELTHGLVNPLILNALETVGYDRSFEQVAKESTVPVPLGMLPPSVAQIEIEPRSRRVRLPPGARLDLGGIAKGWAVEQAAIALGLVGATLVNAGGDLVARGSPDASGGWIVQIPIPNTASARCILLTNGAIATSGTDFRRWQRAGIWQHHLIDPRTGTPAASGIVQASVIAPEMLHAEAWAKAALISDNMPPYPSLLVYETGRIQTNANFEEESPSCSSLSIPYAP